MSSFTLAGRPLISGRLVVPLEGAPVGEVEIDSEDSLTGQVDLELPGKTFKMTVLAGGISEGVNRVRLVGGYGGLQVQVEGQHYYLQTARMIVDAALKTGGERLSQGSDQLSLNATLASWMRPQSTVGEAVGRIAEHLGLNWRVQEDGAVLLASPTWETLEPEHELLEVLPAEERLTVCTENDLVMPGTVFLGRRVQSVEHHLIEERWRSVVYHAGRWTRRSPLADTLRTLVRRLQPVAALAPYECEVVAQNQDGTVDLKPVSAILGTGLSRVPVALMGLFRVKVRPGARCIVDFLDGDMNKPIVRQYLAGRASGATGYCEGAPGTAFATGLQLTGPGGATLRLAEGVTIPPGASRVLGGFESVSVPEAMLDLLTQGTTLAWVSAPPGAAPTVQLETGFGEKGTYFTEAEMADGDAAARVNDPTEGGQLVFKYAGPGALTVTYAEPGGTATEGLTVNLKGKISRGSSVVKKVS